MRRAPALAALLAAALLSACGHEAPVAPPPPPAPQVTFVQPPARSAGYAYDGQIWAMFDRALDPKSVDTTSVFLKQDTKRISCAVSYEPTSRRVVLVPRTTLALNTTYTVILTTGLRSQEGVALAQEYFWQFSTSSIRRVTYLGPALDVLASPVAMLRWSSGDAVAGSLLFEVYAGTDSLAVANRTAPRVGRVTSNFLLPRATWPAGLRTYWAVSTTNQITGEKLDSPVTHFDVLPASAPTRTVSVGALAWGGIQNGRPTVQLCTQTALTVGTGYNAALLLDLSPGQLGKRIKSARLVMYTTYNSGLIPLVTANYCSPTWYSCAMVYPGPPYVAPDGAVAGARVGTVVNEMIFESPGLAAWVEGMLRATGDFSGLMFTLSSSSLLTINMSSSTWPRPVLQVTTYD